jgi:hypothetical protein
VVPPQMPTGGPIGEAVLDDQSHGGPLDPESVTGLGHGQIGRVGEEASPARRTPMLGLPEDEVDRTIVAGVAEVVEAAVCDAVAACPVATARAATPRVIATVSFQARRGQVFGACDPLGNIRDIVTGWAHGHPS